MKGAIDRLKKAEKRFNLGKQPVSVFILPAGYERPSDEMLLHCPVYQAQVDSKAFVKVYIFTCHSCEIACNPCPPDYAKYWEKYKREDNKKNSDPING